jgi:hypothetical protein
MIVGRTDEVDGHFIATKFLGYVVPIESLYFARRGGQAKSTDGGLRIRIDARSVMLGVGRVWLPVLAVVLPIAELLRGGVLPATWIVSAAFIGLSVMAYRGGRLADGEKAKLRLLGSVTGLRIDPSKLRPDTRDVKRVSLGDLMEKGGIPMTAEGIVSVLEDIPVPAIPLVYGYARYAGDDEHWQRCAALLYERYLQSEV